MGSMDEPKIGPKVWDFEGKDDKYPPLAIVGLGMRFPGHVRSTREFEQVMEEGRYVVKDILPDRWDVDRFWHPDIHHSGTHINRKVGMVEGVHDFDHTFFNISPREAGNMDVQHRNCMEVVQEALDDAGIPSESLPKTTGAYVGIGLVDHPCSVTDDPKCMNAYSHTGSSHCVSANRISFHYDINGPSVAIDTACAASLTALHYACFGLWNKECPIALVAGCNTTVMPEICVGFSALGVLAANGMSCPFSADATGYVRSEGVGAVVLKPLEDALNAGDNVYCVIRGTWLAHSGYSLSITMPAADAQAELMKKTYDVFGINKNNVDFIEAHGTGTPVGDPIEAEAIARAFTIDNPERKEPLPFGSAKSHFGHLECAAGMVQVMKVALMLKNRLIYPNIHFREPNPAIDLEGWNMYVPEEIKPFTEDKTYTIGVNTFGFGGSLVHMIFQEFKPPVGYGEHLPGQAGWKIGGGAKKGLKLLIPLSAKNAGALRATAKVWQEYERPEDAQEVACSLSSRRSHYSQRLLIMADSGEDFRNKLQMYQDKVSHEEIIEAQLPIHNEKKSICFIFPGQGQQSFEMGRSLYRDEPVFRAVVDRCDAIFERISGESYLKKYGMFVALKEGVEYDKEIANGILVSQCAIFMLQAGLYHLLDHWGIKADCMVGHSLGEIACAYASGAVDLDTAMYIQYHRAVQQERLSGTGCMAALRVSQEEGAEICKKIDDLFVACVNAHANITMGGTNEAIAKLCAANPDNARKLRVLAAYHTPHLDPIRDDMLKALKDKVHGVKPHRSAWYSSTTGTGHKHDTAVDADFFWTNIRGTVHFLEGVQGVMRDYENIVFVELAGSATLLSAIRAIAKEEGVQPAAMVSCGQRGKDDRVSTLRALSSIYALGINVNWANLHGNTGHWMQLPKYAWQKQTFRYETEHHYNRRLDVEDRTLRGYNGILKPEHHFCYQDHIINGALTFPKSGFVEYVLEMEFADDEFPVLKNLSFNPEWLPVPEEWDNNGAKVERLQLSLKKQTVKNGTNVSVMAKGTSWADIEIHTNEQRAEQQTIDLGNIKERCSKEYMSGEDFYMKFAEMGVEYADELHFRSVKEAFIGDGECLAELHQFVDKHQRLNVPSLDGAFSVVMAAFRNNRTLFTLRTIDSLRMFNPTLPRKTSLFAHSKLTSASCMGMTGDVVITDTDGNVLVEVSGLRFENMTSAKTGVDLNSCLYTTEWQPVDSCLPPISTVVDFFKEKNLKKFYPEEMEKIEISEKQTATLMELIAAYAKHAVNNCAESEVHAKNLRWYKRLCNMTKQYPTKLTIEDLPAIEAKMLLEDPAGFMEYRMVQRMGPLVPEALKDPKVGLGELFQEDMMKAFFLDSLATRIYYMTTAENIRRACLEARKKKQVVNVLEVGGRFGGMSHHILTAIQDLLEEGSVHYTFTDINIAFFDIVEESLKKYPNVKFQQLDVDRDVVLQNFTPNVYDIVIALDTLHCTRDAIESTSILRDLVCKDGWLILIESTNNRNLPDVVFGAFDLSWIFEDSYRKDRCLMGQKEWKDIMQKSGFSDVVALSTPREFYHSLIIGRRTNLSPFYKELQAKRSEEPVQVPTEKPMWLLVHTNEVELASAVKGKLPKNTKIALVEEFENMAESLASYDGVLNIVYFNNKKDVHMSDALKVLKTCQTLGDRPASTLWVITEEATGKCKSIEASAATAFLRSGMAALSNMHGVLIDVEHSAVKDHVQNIMSAIENYTEYNSEISVRNKTSHVRRVIRRPKMIIPEKTPASDWRAEAEKLHFDSLALHQMKSKTAGAGEVQVKVEAIALNPKEIQTIQKKEALMPGSVCSGAVTQVGADVKDYKVTDDVIAFANQGCMASAVNAKSQFVFKRPHNVSAVDCVASCAAYVEAYHGIINRCDLSSNDTVLIVGASEMSGMAATAIAQHLKAKAICAVDTEEQKKFVEHHFGAAIVVETSAALTEDVMKTTNGNGVQVVFNAAGTQAAMEQSIVCLATNGHYCHVTTDRSDNTQLSMLALDQNCSLHSINLASLQEHPNKFRDVTQKVLGLLEKSKLKPLPSRVHFIGEFKEALEEQEGEEQMGTLVFDVPKGFTPEHLEPARELFKADAVYIVTGGTSGVGAEMLRWMAERGARHLISISSSSSGPSWFYTDTATHVRELGANIIDIQADLCDEQVVREQLAHLFKNNHPPVKGIFHLAGAFEDTQLEDLDEESIRKVIQTKLTSAHIIGNLVKEMKIDLDHFVLMSTSKVTWGVPTLGAFSAAAGGLDALATQLREQNLPALSIQAGWIRGAGLLEDRERSEGIQEYTKNTTLHITEFLAILGKLLSKSDLPPVVAVTNEDWDLATEHTKNKLCFNHLASPGGKKGGLEISLDDLQEKIIGKLANLLMMSAEDIDAAQPMVLYGVDSLISLDIVNWLRKEFSIVIDQMQILEGLTTLEVLEQLS